jgi:alcohol dehydrogenase class IV
LQFSFAKIPEIVFGSGYFIRLPEYVRRYGRRVLVIYDPLPLRSAGRLDFLFAALDETGLTCFKQEVSGEPSPELIDRIVAAHGDNRIAVVVAIGGGSVVDTGKAVSAMLGKTESVAVYLEGVGGKAHDGSKVPFIALPTTAGTGSEATKNAVLSQVGAEGFKKSIRHNNFVPDVALIDPQLSETCPAAVTAACGMDAFTQLLESYLSTNASALTDALAWDGLRAIRDNLVAAAGKGAHDVSVRSQMSYAALLSGITLANAGLGIVHGLASPMGGYSDIPHGVACGTLIGVATRINIERLREDRARNSAYLQKFARVGQLFSDDKCVDVDECCDLLVDTIDSWIDTLHIPRLSRFGFDRALIDKISTETGNKYNPVQLSKADIQRILNERL